MTRRTFFCGLLTGLLTLITLATAAQDDALNLPTELYVLTAQGRVERYSLGALGMAEVTPADDIVSDFGVAPDGIWLAYRVATGGGALRLLEMLSGETRTLEGPSAGAPPFRGRGATIAWSPDGEVIAYTVDAGLRVYFNTEPVAFADVPTTPLLHLEWSPDSRYLAAETENNIWWVYRREGRQMVLHAALPSSLGTAWADTNVLMFAPEDGGLFLMDLAQANAQAQIAASDTFYRLPVVRGGGELALFARPANDRATLETAGYLTRVTFPQGGARLEQLSQSSVDLPGLRWAPGGRLLITLRGGVLALVDPNSAQGFALPMTGVVAYGWGAVRPPGAATLTPPTAAYFVADDISGERGLWRLGRDANPPAPVLLLDAEADVPLAFAVAPDGVTLAYAAEGRIWLLTTSADAPLPLAEVTAEVGTLAFSPDGAALAYDAGGDIFTLAPLPAQPVAGGDGDAPLLQAALLLAGYTAPRYTPDGGALTVRLPDGDAALFTPATGDVRRLGAFDDVLFMRDGRVVAAGAPTRDGVNGLYLLDTTGQAPPALLFAAPAERALLAITEAAAGQARIVIGRRGGPASLQVFDVPVAGGQSRLVAQPGYVGLPVLSADGAALAGVSSAAGTLVVVDLAGGREIVYSQAARVAAFTWADGGTR